MPPAINIDEIIDADPLPPLPYRPSTFDKSLHDKTVEEQMSRNPWILNLHFWTLITHFEMTMAGPGILPFRLLLMTIDEAKMIFTMTMTKMTTMSLLDIHWLIHIHLYLLIVHSYFLPIL